MGYDVNYNAVDYADSRAICVDVYTRLQQMELSLLRAAQQAAQCQDDLNLQCSIAGVAARGYNLALLAEHLRNGYLHATEAVIAGRRLDERVRAAIENYESAEQVTEKMLLAANWLHVVTRFLQETSGNGNRPPTQQMETMLQLLMLANPWNILRPEAGMDALVTETTKQLGEAIGTMDPDGRVVEHEIVKSVICTAERMTYEDTIMKIVIAFGVLAIGAAVGWFAPVLAIPGAIVGGTTLQAVLAAIALQRVGKLVAGAVDRGGTEELELFDVIAEPIADRRLDVIHAA